jgi:hypothetical protein
MIEVNFGVGSHMASEKNFVRGPRIRSGVKPLTSRADAAVLMGQSYEGWCPKGGWAEDFLRPPGLLTIYLTFMETPSESPTTNRGNVRDSVPRSACAELKISLYRYRFHN